MTSEHDRMLGVLDRAIARLVPDDGAERLASLLDDAIDRMAPGPRPTHPSAGNLPAGGEAPSGPAAPAASPEPASTSRPAPAQPAAPAPWGHVVPAGAPPINPWAAPAAPEAAAAHLDRSAPILGPVGGSSESEANPVADALAHAFRRETSTGSVTATSSGYHPASPFTLVPGTGISSEAPSEAELAPEASSEASAAVTEVPVVSEPEVAPVVDDPSVAPAPVVEPSPVAPAPVWVNLAKTGSPTSSEVVAPEVESPAVAPGSLVSPFSPAEAPTVESPAIAPVSPASPAEPLTLGPAVGDGEPGPAQAPAAKPLSRPVWQANLIAATIGVAVLIILIWLVNAL